MVSKRRSVKRRSKKRSTTNKRSANSWNSFVTKNYKKVKAQHPRNTMGQIMVKLAKMYRGGGRTSSKRSSPRKRSRRSTVKRSRSPTGRRSSNKKYKYNANWAPSSTIYY